MVLKKNYFERHGNRQETPNFFRCLQLCLYVCLSVSCSSSEDEAVRSMETTLRDFKH